MKSLPNHHERDTCQKKRDTGPAFGNKILVPVLPQSLEVNAESLSEVFKEFNGVITVYAKVLREACGRHDLFPNAPAVLSGEFNNLFQKGVHRTSLFRRAVRVEKHLARLPRFQQRKRVRKFLQW